MRASASSPTTIPIATAATHGSASAGTRPGTATRAAMSPTVAATTAIATTTFSATSWCVERRDQLGAAAEGRRTHIDDEPLKSGNRARGLGWRRGVLHGPEDGAHTEGDESDAERNVGRDELAARRADVLLEARGSARI